MPSSDNDIGRMQRRRGTTMSQDFESVAEALVADGKGILAADETVPTLTKRFDTLGIRSTEQSRRTYREMLFSAPDASDFISGVILQDETIRQQSAGGRPLVSLLSQQGMIPGIKVDTGAKPLAGYPGETVTEGLDGLRERLAEYRRIGAALRNGGPSSMSRPRCRARLRPRERARAGALCGALSGTGFSCDRRAGGAHGWAAFHRALRRGERNGSA